MYKKILLIMVLFLLCSCSVYNTSTMSLEEIIALNIQEKNTLYNTNNKGYRYYLPKGFTVEKDEQYNQVLMSKNSKYYMHVDIVSYYYKNPITVQNELDDYKYYAFNSDVSSGYLRVTKDELNEGYFFVELCYNYAIIEVEVEEDNIQYAVSRSINILSSIKYNDTIIGSAIGEIDLEQTETLYQVPKPNVENDSDNTLQFITPDDDEEDTEEEKNLPTTDEKEETPTDDEDDEVDDQNTVPEGY